MTKNNGFLFCLSVLLLATGCTPSFSMDSIEVWYQMTPYDEVYDCLVAVEIDYAGERDARFTYFVDYSVVFSPEDGDEIIFTFPDYPVPDINASDGKVFGGDETLYIHNLSRNKYIVTVTAKFMDKTYRHIGDSTKSVLPTVEDWQERMYGAEIGC